MAPGTGNADLIGAQAEERSDVVPVGASELIGGGAGEDQQVLRHRIDELTQELWRARDALYGAEAEKGAARARTGEVEHYLHLRTVEVEQLTEKLALLSTGDHPPEFPNLGTARSMVGRARRALSELRGRLKAT